MPKKRVQRIAEHHPWVLKGDVPGRTVLNKAVLCKTVFAVSCFPWTDASPCHRVVRGTKHLTQRTEVEEHYGTSAIPDYIFQ